MISVARALRDETVATIESYEAEIARLRRLADALEAFIAQPGQESAVSPMEVPVPVSQPSAGPEDPGQSGATAPVSGPAGLPAAPFTCDACGTSFTTSQGLGRHRSWRHRERFEPKRIDDRPHHNARRPSPGVDPIARADAAEGGPTAELARARPPKPRPQTATPATRHGRVQCTTCKDWFVSAETLAAHRERSHAATNAHGGGESWLCHACAETFATREARDLHALTHPQPAPDLSVGRDPFAQRPVGAGGVQIA